MNSEKYIGLDVHQAELGGISCVCPSSELSHSDWQSCQLSAHHGSYKLTSAMSVLVFSKEIPPFDPFARLGP
jgi:hypothetical protein